MAKVGQVEKLNAKAGGVIAWEVDGVLARFSKNQFKDTDLSRDVKPLIGMVAATLAHIKERVTKRGELGTDQRFPGYGKRSDVRVSSAYAGLAGSTTLWFDNETKFHTAARTVLGSFDVSGGLWGQPQARAQAKHKGRMEFAGSSPGRGKLVQSWVTKSSKSGGPPVRRKVRTAVAQNVTNRQKGSTVLFHSKVHLLAPQRVEELAMREAVVDAVVFGQGMQWLMADSPRVPVEMGGDKQLRQRINQLW